ncbi:MAG: biopolymer transport protein ExbD [Bacteroidia bacterium]|jgi:biopolymer transport protein ExbD
MKLKKRNKVAAEFNMSSMTDIIFLLLIFFIITSKFTPEPILKVLLPKGAITEVTKQTIKVTVNAELKYAVDNEIMNFDRLPEALDAALTQNPGATVSIYGAKSVNYEKVMDLVYMVNELGGKPVLALKPVK